MATCAATSSRSQAQACSVSVEEHVNICLLIMNRYKESLHVLSIAYHAHNYTAVLSSKTLPCLPKLLQAPQVSSQHSWTLALHSMSLQKSSLDVVA